MWGIFHEMSQKVTLHLVSRRMKRLVSDDYPHTCMQISRGFEFVEIAAKAETQSGIAALGARTIKGRVIRSNEANPE